MENYKLDNSELSFNKIRKFKDRISITKYGLKENNKLLLNVKNNYYLITLIKISSE